MPRARSRTNAAAIKTEDLHYLAGIFESSLGLRGPGTQGAMAISNSEDWPKNMATLYGGYAEEFQSGRTEKWYWGWFVPLERRLELLNLLESSGVTKNYSTEDFVKSRHRIEKAINSQKERERQDDARDRKSDQSPTRQRARAESAKRSAEAREAFEPE